MILAARVAELAAKLDDICTAIEEIERCAAWDDRAEMEASSSAQVARFYAGIGAAHLHRAVHILIKSETSR